MKTALVAAATILFCACGHEIIPPPPAGFPRADGAELPLKALVVNDERTYGGKAAEADVTADGVPLPNPAKITAQTLEKTGLFGEVVSDLATAGRGYVPDLVVSLKLALVYKPNHSLWVPMFFPLCDPFLIGCGYRFENTCTAEISATVRDGARKILKQYSEKQDVVAPHTIDMINGTGAVTLETECHDSSVRNGVVKIAQDFIKDRARYAAVAPAAPAAPAGEDGEAPRAAPAAAPWWQK
jgi:hypothetical protein